MRTTLWMGFIVCVVIGAWFPPMHAFTLIFLGLVVVNYVTSGAVDRELRKKD